MKTLLFTVKVFVEDNVDEVVAAGKLITELSSLVEDYFEEGEVRYDGMFRKDV